MTRKVSGRTLSLFGLTALDEIDDALLRAMYPALGWKATRIAGRIAKSAAKHFNISSDLKLGEMFDKFKAGLYVFDDLERCEMPINKTLGYINEFVEHDGCKVIIIANEAEIVHQEEYKRRREKLIGKTLEVQSAFEEALDYFTLRTDSPDTRALFTAKAAEISTIYHQSGLDNLRILQQTMWDFERFHRALTEEHHQNDGAMTDLLSLIFALSFELRADRIRTNDLTKRMNSIVSRLTEGKDSAVRSALAIAQQRYPEVRLDNTVLSNDLLTDILVKGIVDETDIRTALDRSSYFVASEQEPAWRTVWFLLERDDEEFNAALVRMEEQFAAREFVVTGEILHVFGLRLWLVAHGILEKSRPEIVSECKAYVDYLYANGRLEAMPSGSLEKILRSSGYAGLGIYEHETEEYRQLFNYLDDKRKTADMDRYPEKAATLLQEMEANPDLFFRRLNFTNSDDNLYGSVPILAEIDPDVFVSSFLKLHPKQQREILVAFKPRYENNRIDNELSQERIWLDKVRTKFASSAESMTKVGRYRLLTNIEWAFNSISG
jgi:hypothetical protein